MTDAKRPDHQPGPQAGLTPSDAPVDVPRTPTKDNIKDDVAGTSAKPRVNTDADSAWADNADPAPRKPNARSNPY
ncbi:hypothetical protein IMZ29_20055 [Achromobacter sp. GG226]|uniref:hypothetical protein n=1 Tax=Verticiella alkaliphila TaxID=2779529 RepID=UPI001C0ADEF0|nr:hypothetical protein [Verticiella sp. GG226]MBU4612750.1 hypothetical protein [Verticiella sp. GG226]